VQSTAAGAIIRARFRFQEAKSMSQDSVQNSEQDSAQDKEAPQPNEDSATEGPERQLYPEDQAKVDAFLKRGVNSVERKPFKPLYLLVMLIVVVAGLSLFSQWLARQAGVF